MPQKDPEQEVNDEIEQTLNEHEAEEAAMSEAFGIFRDVHRAQLLVRGVPESLWQELFVKLHSECFDAGEVFQLAPADGTNGVRAYRLVPTAALEKPENDIWVIDHAWSTTTERASAQLAEHPNLVQRLHAMLRDTEEDTSSPATADADTDAAAAAAATAAAASEDEAKSVPTPLDEGTIEVLMQQTGASRELAEATLRDTDSDLVSALEKLQGTFDEAAAGPADAAGAAAAYRPDNADDMADFEKAMAEHCQISSPNAPGELEAMRARVLANLYADERGADANGLAHCYFLQVNESGAEENAEPKAEQVWYVMDEVGSAVVVGATAERPANARLVPFVCATLEGQAFSLLWITKPVAAGESIVVEKVAV